MSEPARHSGMRATDEWNGNNGAVSILAVLKAFRFIDSQKLF
jgi:hypothetical protein